MNETWGVIQQNLDSPWENRPNNLPVDGWERTPPPGNWGAGRPSAPTPSENNLSSKRNAQTWSQNKSENSWASRNEVVRVDESNWPTRKEEPAISDSGYQRIKHESEEEKAESLAMQVGIQQSFESLRNDDHDRQHIVLDEDGYDQHYGGFSSKPQLNNKSVAPPFDEIQFNSSDSTFQEFSNKRFRDVEVQTDTINISKLIGSNEKLLSITVDSQHTRQDLSRSTNNNVSEVRYPPQQRSLLDEDLEESNTKSNLWNTSSDNFREATATTPPTKPDTNSRGEWNTTAILPKPGSDSWDSKPTSTQNDSWNTAQRTSTQNDNRDPASQSISQTSVRNDNRGTAPQSIPVEPDNWDAPIQTSARNESWKAPSQTSARNESWKAPSQTFARNESNSWKAPSQTSARDESNSWKAPSQTSARDESNSWKAPSQNNRSAIPQSIPVEPDSWDAPPQTSTRNDPTPQSMPQISARNDNIPQVIPVKPDSWDASPQTSTRNDPTPQPQMSARNDNRSATPQVIPVEPDNWDAPPQTSTRNDPTPQSMPQISARNDNIPQVIPVEPDSWDSAPKPTQNNWSAVPQPAQNNNWNSGQQQSWSKDTISQEGPKGSGTVQQNESKERPTQKQDDTSWINPASNSDWTKQAELFSKELENSENEVIQSSANNNNDWIRKTEDGNKAIPWGQTSNAEPKSGDPYGTGASDSYYDNSSQNNRHGRGGCHNCGQEGHFARDCPDKKQGYGGSRHCCHNCGKEGHLARDCTEENSKAGYGGGKCHKCGKEGHFARDCKEDAYETIGQDGSYGGSRYHMKTSPFSNPEPSSISSQDAWAKVLKADKEQDIEDFSEAIELYAKVTSEETLVTIEKKLRDADCNGRIIALERTEIPLTKVLMDLQGNTNKKYVARLIMGNASRLPRTSGNRADNDDENLRWLADSGFMVDDHSTPICFNCKQKGHATKDCPEPKKEIERPSHLPCQHCKSTEHSSKYCLEERRDFYTEARDRKVAGSYKSEYSANEDRASGYDGEDDRKGYRGYGSNNSNPTCYNCNREGHISRDCPEPKRGGGASSGYDGEDDRRGYRGPNNTAIICRNCNEEGHISRDCPTRGGERKCHKCGEEGHLSRNCTSSSGGGYDRGNYNSSGGWQRDSFSNNNQDKDSDSIQNRDNSWNKSGGGDNTQNRDNSWNKSGGGDNTQNRDNSWNKSGGGDNTQNRDNPWNKPESDNNYSNNNNKDLSQNKGEDVSRQKDDKLDLASYKVESDSWDSKPKTETTAAGSIDWERGGNKTAADFGWSENKTEDYENRQGRGNESSAPDNYDNRRGRGDDQRQNSYDNRRGRGNDQRENYDNYENYERRGRSDDQKERSYENRRGQRENFENYDNRRGRGNDQRENYNYDNYDNRRGRGNDQRDQRDRPYENRRGQRENSENYDNRRGQRENFENYDNRRGQRESFENYDNRRGRGNDQRERSENYDNRRGRGNYDRYSNSSRTQSNDNNQKLNLDNPKPWW